MITLKAITQTAMLGAANGFSAPILDQVKITGLDLQTSLLASAAVIGIGEIGGRIPILVEDANPVCPLETRPYLPELAVGQLKRVLAGEFEILLPEFLDLIASHGYLAPPELLPALLGSTKADIRQKIIRIMGLRGDWLARLNPAWSYAIRRPPQDAWEHAAFADRLSALEQIRAEQPVEARRWIEATWAQDAPEQRAAFITALEPGLSMEDETLLEACLDDRRKEVRSAARTLLLRLDHSRFALRAWDRAKHLVKKKSRLLVGDQIEVVLPTEVDAAARRDGVGEKLTYKKIGENADLLVQILALVPPVFWSREFGRTPERLVQAAMNCEWRDALLLGWQMAAVHAGDSIWAAALVAAWTERAEVQKALDGESLDALILQMNVESVETLVAESVRPRSAELDDRHMRVTLLKKYQRPWSLNLARMVIQSAQRQADSPPGILAQAMIGFARWIPPELVDEFSDGWGEAQYGQWPVFIDRFLTLLKFRQGFSQNLKKETT